jgi:hypothetical protein
MSGVRGKFTESHEPRLALTLFKTRVGQVPASGDVTNGLPEANLGMLGNDTEGDCVQAATFHLLDMKAWETGEYEPGYVTPTDSTALEDYWAYQIANGAPGPEPDNGSDFSTWLAWALQQGIIEWYGEVDDLTPDALYTAAGDFGGVLLGLSLPDDAIQEFDAGQPWDTSQPCDANEGHAVVLAKWDPSGITIVTWAKYWPTTVPFDQACITDAWVVGSKEDAERAGYNAAAWEAALALVKNTGGTIPAGGAPPAPAPAPAPSPVPPDPPGPVPVTPPPNNPGIWREWISEAREALDEIEAWVESHFKGGTHADT